MTTTYLVEDAHGAEAISMTLQRDKSPIRKSIVAQPTFLFRIHTTGVSVDECSGLTVSHSQSSMGSSHDIFSVTAQDSGRRCLVCQC